MKIGRYFVLLAAIDKSVNMLHRNIIMLLLCEMSEQFESRLIDPAGVAATIADGLEQCGLGKLHDHRLITVGFEDYNVLAQTDRGTYFVKILAKTRSSDEIYRYATILDAVANAGISHPKLYRDASGDALVRTNDRSSIFVMDAVDGETFYDKNSSPNDEELDKIIEQVIAISQMDLSPPFEFDTWAVPNIRALYDKLKGYIAQIDRPFIDEALRRYESLPLGDLPTCFVHGDLTKANIIAGNDGVMHIIDFSVANIYPRIQELVVMASSLIYDSEQYVALRSRIDSLVEIYMRNGGVLTDVELGSIYDYTLAAMAMEYLGSLNEQHTNGDSEEIRHWQQLGIDGLRRELTS